MAHPLVEVLRERAQLLAEGISLGMWRWGAPGYYGGSWRAYNASEQLVGALISEDPPGVMYHRPGYPHAKLWLTNIRPLGEIDVEFGEDRIVETNILEKEHDHIKVAASGVVETITIEHVFKKVTTREDSYKQSIEEAFKESLRFGGEKSKVGGGLEAEQRAVQQFEQKYGSEDTQQDTVRRVVSVAGPRDVVYDAIRRSDRVEQPVSVHADLSFQVNIDDETQIGPAQTWWQVIIGQKPPTTNRVHQVWSTFTELVAIFKGDAPISWPLARQFNSTTGGAQWDDGKIARLEKRPEHANWIQKFINVTSMDIDIENEEELTEPVALIPLAPSAITPPVGES